MRKVYKAVLKVLSMFYSIVNWLKVFILALRHKIKPTKEVLDLAKVRLDECNKCEFYSKNSEEKACSNKPGYCTICKCLISIKIFTDKDSEIKCPEDRWQN